MQHHIDHHGVQLTMGELGGGRIAMNQLDIAQPLFGDGGAGLIEHGTGVVEGVNLFEQWCQFDEKGAFAGADFQRGIATAQVASQQVSRRWRVHIVGDNLFLMLPEPIGVLAEKFPRALAAFAADMVDASANSRVEGEVVGSGKQGLMQRGQCRFCRLMAASIEEAVAFAPGDNQLCTGEDFQVMAQRGLAGIEQVTQLSDTVGIVAQHPQYLQAQAVGTGLAQGEQRVGIEVCWKVV